MVARMKRFWIGFQSLMVMLALWGGMTTFRRKSIICIYIIGRIGLFAQGDEASEFAEAMTRGAWRLQRVKQALWDEKTGRTRRK